MKEIKGFFGEYRFLSNFWPCQIVYKGFTFQSSEALFMAHKSGLEEDFEKFSKFIKPGDAKRAGKQVQLRSDWDQIKFDVMEKVLRLKFEQNPDLMEKLLATGDTYLEETNHWKDLCWGVCEGLGENNLGKLLMRLREKNK